MNNPTIDTPGRIAAFWRKHVAGAEWFRADQEQLCVFLLNTRRRLIGFELVGLGTADACLWHAREVFRPAIVAAAVAVVVAHNHPSGDPSPSDGDIAATRHLRDVGHALGLELLDHVIIGQRAKANEKGYASLRETGYFAETSTIARGERNKAEEEHCVAGVSVVTQAVRADLWSFEAAVAQLKAQCLDGVAEQGRAA